MNDSPRTPASAGAAQAVSPETAFVLAADDAKLLTEVGFLAAGAGDVARAETIFKALRRLRPAAAYPLIGLAVAWMNTARAPDAVALLESAVMADPAERALLDAWRGFALQLAGRNGESRRLLESVAGGEGDGATLARGLLGLPQEGA
ncbi:tetratricopeptide repeat protein [Achromobacter sp.]|uniref:tetratricopeptide repeat protein n=1 Tax=Achromobacter sp. TaxID=134375 RepID=UPI0028B1AE05|nr:tetratricopeptide repeat protein [Achromobacter sp.]